MSGDAVTRQLCGPPLPAAPDIPWLPSRPEWHPSGHPIIAPLSEQQRMAFLVGLGVIGGGIVAYWGADHMFKHGMTAQERRGVLTAAGSLIGVVGLAYLLDVDQKYWELQAMLEALVQHYGGGDEGEAR